MNAVECGTYSGYSTHVRKKEEVCPACREARKEYQARLRMRRGIQRLPWQCGKCGSVFRDHRCGG